MNIGRKLFSELRADKRFAIVLLGAGDPLADWVTGVSGMLVDEKIVPAPPEDVFTEAFVLGDNVRGSQGRTDLVLVFTPDRAVTMGRLAMWRLRFGDCMWSDDFCDSHADEYLSGHRAAPVADAEEETGQ